MILADASGWPSLPGGIWKVARFVDVFRSGSQWTSWWLSYASVHWNHQHIPAVSSRSTRWHQASGTFRCDGRLLVHFMVYTRFSKQCFL